MKNTLSQVPTDRIYRGIGLKEECVERCSKDEKRHSKRVM